MMKEKSVRRPWSTEEDEIIMKLVKEHGPKKWAAVVAAELKDRSGEQCRERFRNQLDPSIRKDAFTEEEDVVICVAQKEIGNQFANIAKLLVGRTGNQVKNHWNTTLNRKSETLIASLPSEHYQGIQVRCQEHVEKKNRKPPEEKRPSRAGIARQKTNQKVLLEAYQRMSKEGSVTPTPLSPDPTCRDAVGGVYT